MENGKSKLSRLTREGAGGEFVGKVLLLFVGFTVRGWGIYMRHPGWRETMIVIVKFDKHSRTISVV